MVSTKEYSNIFDDGIHFAINAINEHCDREFKSLAEVIIAIQELQAQAKGGLMSDDLEFAIKCHEDKHTVRVSPNDDGVWLSLFMSGCNAYTTLDKAQTRQLIDALQSIMEAENV
jgi:hypothetical protein